jgi:hypothetical protein
LLGVLLFTSALTFSAVGSNRVRLKPQYIPGQAFSYRIESRTTTSGKIATPIFDPEGGTASTVGIHLLIRLNVLKASTGTNPWMARLRATYEKSSADSQNDAFDPAHPSPSVQYAKLEGRSLEFDLEPNGHVDNIQGVSDIFPDRATAQSALSWFSEISSGSTFPVAGIEIGQKWKSEHPVEGAPLSDLVSRSESTYLRDEPCHSEPGLSSANVPHAVPENSPQDSCSIVLTRFAILRRGSPHAQATPEEYLRNGLRVSGSWSGSGESLDSISISTGFLVRSTQTSEQQLDYEIASAATGSKIRNQSHIQSQTEIALVFEPPVQ